MIYFFVHIPNKAAEAAAPLPPCPPAPCLSLACQRRLRIYFCSNKFSGFQLMERLILPSLLSSSSSLTPPPPAPPSLPSVTNVSLQTR